MPARELPTNTQVPLRDPYQASAQLIIWSNPGGTVGSDWAVISRSIVWGQAIQKSGAAPFVRRTPSSIRASIAAFPLSPAPDSIPFRSEIKPKRIPWLLSCCTSRTTSRSMSSIESPSGQTLRFSSVPSLSKTTTPSLPKLRKSSNRSVFRLTTQFQNRFRFCSLYNCILNVCCGNVTRMSQTAQCHQSSNSRLNDPSPCRQPEID